MLWPPTRGAARVRSAQPHAPRDADQRRSTARAARPLPRPALSRRRPWHVRPANRERHGRELTGAAPYV